MKRLKKDFKHSRYRSMNIITVFLFLLPIFFSFITISADNGNVPPSTITEIEPNDDFEHAFEIQNGDIVIGVTGLTQHSPIDVFKFYIGSGYTIRVNVTMTNITDSELIRLELFNKNEDRITASSYDEKTFGFISAIAQYSDWYYLQLIPWRGKRIEYTLQVNSEQPPIVSEGQDIHGFLSNETEEWTHWWRIFLHSNVTTNEKVSTSISYDEERCEFGLSMIGIDPGPSKWMYYHDYPRIINISKDYGIPYRTENIIATATYEGYYYLRAYTLKGNGTFNISIDFNDAPSDGDNTPGNTTIIKDRNKSELKYSGRVDMIDDRFDWYQIHLGKYENLTIRLTLDIYLQSGIFGITIYYINNNSELVEKNNSINVYRSRIDNDLEVRAMGSDKDMDLVIVIKSIITVHPSKQVQMKLSTYNSISFYNLTISRSIDEDQDNVDDDISDQKGDQTGSKKEKMLFLVTR